MENMPMKTDVIVPKTESQSILMGLDMYMERRCANIRIARKGKGGVILLTRQGMTIPPELINDVIKGLEQLRDEAVSIGWLPAQ